MCNVLSTKRKFAVFGFQSKPITKIEKFTERVDKIWYKVFKLSENKKYIYLICSLWQWN